MAGTSPAMTRNTRFNMTGTRYRRRFFFVHSACSDPASGTPPMGRDLMPPVIENWHLTSPSEVVARRQYFVAGNQAHPTSTPIRGLPGMRQSAVRGARHGPHRPVALVEPPPTR